MIDDIREQCLSYIGRERVLADSMAPDPAMKLATLFDQPLGDRLRTTWHWAYFNPAIPERDVGHDGHERLGLFMARLLADFIESLGGKMPPVISALLMPVIGGPRLLPEASSSSTVGVMVTP